jgi:uncharacterized protein DUF927
MTDQTNTRKFLTTVWPQHGPYCIATPWVTHEGKKAYAHRSCDTLDDAMAYILINKQSKDLYFAPHALKVARQKNPKTGKLQTFRTHENMREARAFFFDIDPKNYYATQQDTINALEKFLFATCLPAPFVVSSGYGIHVYWIIDEPIESLAWRAHAGRLYDLAQQHKLHVDPSRTVDQSSVLRVPGTFNFKDPGDPRKAMVLVNGVVTPAAEFLAQLGPAPDPPSGPGPGLSGPNSSSELSVAWNGRRPPADEVADVCEHMRLFRDSRGNVSEPQWHVGIGTIKHCDDGAAKAHEWSSGYPGYTQAETEAKIDAWTRPPPSCEKIGRNSGDAAVCARCQHQDLAKNPLLIANLVYQRAHQQVTAPAMLTPPCAPPHPYILDPVHGIREKSNGVICDWLMFPVHWIDATGNEDCLSRWYTRSPRADWQLIEIRNTELELKSLAAALRNKGIILSMKRVKLMHGFMLAYLNELQRHQASLRQYDYVGYEVRPQEPTEAKAAKPVDIGIPEWFILYGRKISVVDGSVVPCVMTKNTPPHGMGRAGSLQRQIAAMQFYNARDYMAQQFAICASLATPYFRYSGLHGALICLTGETGSSKSTGLYFAAGLWGHPKLYGVSGLHSTSTVKARQERCAILRNLPFMVDEITLFEPQEAHEIALSVSQPGSYDSLKSNREFRDARGGYQANLVICTSNKSLVQLVNSNNPSGQAGIMRIFEINVSKNAVHSKTEADGIVRELVENYGWIGEDFLRHCLPHTDAVHNKFLEIQQQLEADINVNPEERFMTAIAATALLGARLGRRLGYHPYQYQLMREWLIDEQIPAVRQTVESERGHLAPETVLNEYLEEINPNICRVKRNTRNDVEILYAPPVEFKARYEIDVAKVYVRIEPFREYCIRRHHNYGDVLDRLMRDGLIICKAIRKRMRPEREAAGNPVLCFVIPMNAASLIVVPNTPKPDSQSRKIVELKTPS